MLVGKGTSSLGYLQTSSLQSGQIKLGPEKSQSSELRLRSVGLGWHLKGLEEKQSWLRILKWWHRTTMSRHHDGVRKDWILGGLPEKFSDWYIGLCKQLAKIILSSKVVHVANWFTALVILERVMSETVVRKLKRLKCKSIISFD